TGDIKLYQLFLLSEKFKYGIVRKDEKIELAKLLDRVPIPINESLEEPSAKINVLFHLRWSSLPKFVISNGWLMQPLFEVVLRRGWTQLAEKVLNLCKMISKRMWSVQTTRKMVSKRMWSVQTPLQQFNGISNEILMKLEKRDIVWEHLYTCV
ncbi:unnamed protein product, partial [Thlaspi arvense]